MHVGAVDVLGSVTCLRLHVNVLFLRPNLSFITVTMKNSFCMYWAERTRLELLSTILTSRCFSSLTDSTCRLQKTKLRSSSYAASASTCHRNSLPTGQLAPLRITSIPTCQNRVLTSKMEKIRECSSNFFFSYHLILSEFKEKWTHAQNTMHFETCSSWIFFFNHLYLRT